MTLRIVGIGLALLAALQMTPGQFDWLNGLLWPLMMTFGAFLAIGNPLVVLIAVGGLALSAAQLAADDIYRSLAYPILAGASLLGIVVILARRWRQRIRDTHDARWERRRQAEIGHHDRD